MEWNARTPSLWDWDVSALPCDAEEYKPPGGSDGGGGDGSWAAAASTSSSTGSSFIVPDVAEVPPVLELEVYHKGASGLIFQDVEHSSPATVAGETRSPPICLKLGKRTYFEDASQADQSAVVVLSKKPRGNDQSLQQQQQQAIYCQVEGCDVDLSGAKEYYRKHRVCEDHTKCPRVIVAGQERRFCQQCSRFHELFEFDQKKRSCRKRLSDHNARRRKPQPDMISFCSSIFSLSTYDDGDGDDAAHQISFQRDKISTPNGNMTKTGARPSAWGFLYDSKLPQTRSWPLLTNAGEGHEWSAGWTAVSNEVMRIRPLKGGSTAGVLNQISSAVASVSNFKEGLDQLPGALSLMSSNPPHPSSDPGEISTSSLYFSDCTSTLINPILHECKGLYFSQPLLAKPWTITVSSASNYSALLSDARL